MIIKVLNTTIQGLIMILALVALFAMPYEYYVILRAFVFVGMIIIFVLNQNISTRIIALVVGVVFNPISPFYLDVIIWKALDIGVAAWMGFLIYRSVKTE
jgi:uncharacterized protein DUF6804